MKILREIAFYVISAMIIIPAPIFVLAHMTGMTFEQVMWR
jgi:hypothetical protein